MIILLIFILDTVKSDKQPHASSGVTQDLPMLIEHIFFTDRKIYATGEILETTAFAESPTTITSASTITAEPSGIELHPKKRLRVSSIESMTSDNSSTTNVTAVEINQSSTTSEPATGEIPETTAFAESPTTITSASTITAEPSGIELHPKKRLKVSSIESMTSDNSSATNVTAVEINQSSTTSEPATGEIPETTAFAESPTTITSASTITAEPSGIKLHPKKRLKVSSIESMTSDNSSATNVTAVEINQSSTTSEPTPFTNYYQMFLNIRKQIHEKHMSMFPVQPKPPFGFEDYLMNRRTYILDSNYKNRVVHTQTPTPTNLHKHLKSLFVEQEKERQNLRVKHLVEKEKLVLSVEQEILRVHGRAARVLANQPLPFSVCTVLKDNDVYKIMKHKQEEYKNEHVHSGDNGRIFLSWLQEIDDKWEKIKIDLLLRQHYEADSLHAVQKMNWGWKLKEIQLCTYSSLEPNIDEEHVPMVQVNKDFDHFPA
ncbi:unnamed protein product [Macrosiphum euphorbiae]|uniref:Ankyrin repeat domain-containing protein 12 n=1 Tax=Macrosiphum euphorbiae TaxID=13131 RepID=A0AAV0Y880_9HEMI|nr:unnamed protein product [Macrosiphum euphorbiae]